MSPTTKGYVIALIGIAFWSTTGIFISYLITRYGMPALLLAGWRNLFASAVLILVLYFVRRSLLRVRREQIGFYLLYGLVLALLNSVWVLAIETNGAAVATVLIYSSAGFTAILGWWLFGERMGVAKVTAILLSLGGCVLVAKAYSPEIWALNPLAVITGLLSGLAFAGYSLMGKAAAKRKINAWTSTTYAFIFGSAFIMVFNLLPILPGAVGTFGAFLPNLPLDGWLLLLILSCIPTVLGFGLYNTSMNYLQASIANLLATLEPVMTAVEAYIFLGERMTVIQFIGSLLILTAVAVVQLEKE